MSDPAKKKATYEELYSLPDSVIGEIVNGELIATPRPGPRHSKVVSILTGKIIGPFQLGESGGPGGWTLLFEPELQLSEHTLVPDLAGWKKERLPDLPETNWISVPPDWICEVLSPTTVRIDKNQKMPIYAQFGVPYLWLIDPINKILDVFRLDSGKWTLLTSYAENDNVRAEPFQEVEIDLALLWT